MVPEVASDTKPECTSNNVAVRELTELISKLDSLPASVEPKSSDNFRDTPSGSCHAQDCTSGGGSKGSSKMFTGSCGTTGPPMGVLPDAGATNTTGELWVDAVPSSSTLLRERNFSFSPRRSSTCRRKSPMSASD